MRRWNIPLAKPNIDKKDAEAVRNAIMSGWITQGSKVREFEEKISKYVGTKYAIMVASGTAALHLAYNACGIKPRDEVLMPSLTYVATANAALYLRAKPVFVDVDRSTYNMNPQEIIKKVENRTKAVVVVHWAGLPADMTEISEICTSKELILIEDSAQSFGATYKQRKVGTFGEASCFSFSAIKNLTTGEGGAVVTDNPEIAEKVRMLRDQGQPEGQRLHHTTLGYNYRSTDMAAALGLSQINKVKEVIERKRKVFSFMSEKLKKTKHIIPPYVPRDRTHVYTHYMIRVKESDGFDRDALMKAMEISGIECRVYAQPIHLQPFFQKLSTRRYNLPVTEDISSTSLCLPTPSNISIHDAQQMLDVIRTTVQKNKRCSNHLIPMEPIK